jgi:hypothetical protein
MKLYFFPIVIGCLVSGTVATISGSQLAAGCAGGATSGMLCLFLDAMNAILANLDTLIRQRK